jgi:CubicO group peptidase (beta-lactamase class C family)
MSRFILALALQLAIIVGAFAQKVNNPWTAAHGLTSDQYQQKFNELVSQGYRLNYVSGYTFNNEPHFAAVWEQKASPAWVARHGMTASDYQTAFNTYVGEGYRLVLVNGYAVNGEDNYVAIWDKSPPPAAWVAHHGMTSSDYQSTFNALVAQGYRLTHVSGYSLGTEALYAAIWELRYDGVTWEAHHGMTSAAYQTQFNTLVGQGYRLVDVSGYEVNGVDYYAAIWEKSPGPLFIAAHGLTSTQYQGEFDNNLYQGYVLRVVSGYTSSGSDRYAAIWQNTVMSGSDLSLIDSKVTGYMNAHLIPGLSIAIAQNDRLVFAKGYGSADEEADINVNPTHLFRIASISKTFTSVAIETLIQEGHFDITDKVFGPGGVLGTIYGTKPYGNLVEQITVQNLLEHTSGWDASDPRIDVTVQLNSRTQAEMISYVLDNVVPVRVPGTVGDYLNFGFLVLGRVIEEVTGQPYEAYLKNNIMNQCQITRMQIGEDYTARLPDEVKYYPVSPSYAYDYPISRFDSFGGWVASAIDLTRLMVRIDNITAKPDILFPSTLTQMFTPSAAFNNGGYAKGWIVNSDYRGHNGALWGTRAFYAQLLSGNFSFAVIGNNNTLYPAAPDVGSFDLETVMESICTSVSSWPGYDLFTSPDA